MKPTAVPQDGANAGRALGGRGLAMPPVVPAVPAPAGWECRESPAGPRRCPQSCAQPAPPRRCQAAQTLLCGLTRGLIGELIILL
ncbi:hypothetical protein Nmel_000317 [Mimus melanotis]